MLLIKVTGQWVKGHYTGEDRKVQHDLNALVDFMADHFHRNPPPGYEPLARPYPHPSSRAHVYSDGSAITSKLRQVIYRNFFSASLRATICKHNQWSPSQFQSIDWRSFGMAFRTYSKFRQIGLTKMVHKLWHTGAQKLKFQLDEEGLCPCCQTCVETTSHVFQCQAPLVVGYRTKKLQEIDAYLATQEFSRSLKENISAGLHQWTSSTEWRASVVSPTRGRVAPLEQVATQAFNEQTQLGWDAFLTGQLSIYWRKALLFGSSTGDEDSIDSILRQLIKKLFALSLSLWDFRNGVLHGETYQMQREKRRALICERVIEAYDYFAGSPNSVLPQDRYLFTRKDVAARLKSDDDALLCWLWTVEVAMTTMDRQQARARAHAEKFFAPFRAAGLQKSLGQEERNADLDALGADQQSSMLLEEIGDIQIWSSASEEQQLSDEVSSYARGEYRGRKCKKRALSGLEDTVLADLWDQDLPEMASYGSGALSVSDDSIASPSCFFHPIIEQDISSDSSSYCPSRQRDVVLWYDSDTVGGHSLQSVSSVHRAAFFRLADEVERRLDGGLGETASSPATTGSTGLDVGDFEVQLVPKQTSEVEAMRLFLERKCKGQVVTDRVTKVALGSSLSSMQDIMISAPGSTSDSYPLFDAGGSPVDERSFVGVTSAMIMPRFSAEVETSSSAPLQCMEGVSQASFLDDFSHSSGGDGSFSSSESASPPGLPLRVSPPLITFQVFKELRSDALGSQGMVCACQLAQTSGSIGSEASDVLVGEVGGRPFGMEGLSHRQYSSWASTHSSGVFSSGGTNSFVDGDGSTELFLSSASPSQGMIEELTPSSYTSCEEGLEEGLRRALSFSPPSDTSSADMSEPASMPSLEEGNGDTGSFSVESVGSTGEQSALVVASGVGSFGGGQPQGSALSPSSYMVVLSQLRQMEEQLSAQGGVLGSAALPANDRSSGVTEQELEQVTFKGYMNALLQGAASYDGNGAQQYLANYYGEFYDYDPQSLYYDEGEERGARDSLSSNMEQSALPIAQEMYEGDMVASTVSYISHVLVQQVTSGMSDLQLEGTVVNIPFREQDDPPDDADDVAASLEVDSANELW